MATNSRSFTTDARAVILNVVRRHGRPVLWTDASMGFGNLLYRYLHAWTQRREGHEEWVLAAPSCEPWLDVFPALREMTLTRRQVNWWDQRDLEDYQGFGIAFTREELEHFVTRGLLSGDFTVTDDLGGLTLNVRRGDFYSERWRPLYGFDVEGYVARALAVANRQEPVERVRIVSDDVGWCMSHLPALLNGVELSVPDNPSPVGDLTALAGARRLVLANSTFSYWGAFLSNAVHGHNHETVMAPRFHRRDINGGLSWHLDPRWTTIDDPAGWPRV